MLKRSPPRAKTALPSRDLSLIESRIEAGKIGAQKRLAAENRSLAGKVVLPYRPSSFTIRQLKTAIRRLKKTAGASAEP